MADTLSAVRREVVAETALQTRIRERTARAVTARVEAFDRWYDPAAVDALSASLGQVVLAGSRQAASTTTAYLGRVTPLLGFEQTSAPAPDAITGPLRSGVPTFTAVYGRLAPSFRFLVSTGVTVDDARSRTADRADAMVQTDLQLARRRAARNALWTTTATRYRRIIHPEASQSGVCGLCAVAADRLYYRQNLMPIHDRCKCTVLPAQEAGSAALDLNRETLDSVYGATGRTPSSGWTSPENLLGVRAKIVQHGELGPVLVNAKHRTRILDAA